MPSNQMMAKGEDLRLKGGNVPVQRRRYAARWNRLSADRFFAALSEDLENVYATISRGRNGQGS
jgi:hypothetical protein